LAGNNFKEEFSLGVFLILVAMIIYQVGSLVITGKFGIGTIFGFIGIAAIIYGLVRKPSEEK